MNRDLASRIALDTADFCDLIWRKANEARANPASQDRAGALRAEPLRVSGKAAHRLSQEESDDEL